MWGNPYTVSLCPWLCRESQIHPEHRPHFPWEHDGSCPLAGRCGSRWRGQGQGWAGCLTVCCHLPFRDRVRPQIPAAQVLGLSLSGLASLCVPHTPLPEGTALEQGAGVGTPSVGARAIGPAKVTDPDYFWYSDCNGRPHPAHTLLQVWVASVSHGLSRKQDYRVSV